MHFPSRRLIFIHIPKTGGNWIQKNLLVYSDDKLFKSANHQDLENRFDVIGSKTRFGKHQTLGQAVAQLSPADRKSYRYFSVIRHPISRLVSFYFSPHRWLATDGNSFYEREKFFDIDQFRTLIGGVPTLSEMLCLNIAGRNVLPDELTIIRYENFESDLRSFMATHKFDVDESRYKVRVNQNSADKTLISDVLRSSAVIKAIMDSRHARDFYTFGYPP